MSGKAGGGKIVALACGGNIDFRTLITIIEGNTP